MTTPILTLSGIERRYNDFHALKPLDLAVNQGEFVAIMGPSGCGKSTLLRLIGGLDEPTAGDIRIAGVSMGGVPAHQRDTPMVWQSLALFPFLSAADNVAFPLRMRGVGKVERQKRAGEWLERLGLGGMGGRFVTELSGGQLQRVAIARALVTEPRILLLDEPLSALDPHLRVRMQNELARLHRELGITFIYVTHTQSEAFALADRVIIMNGGVVQQIGKPTDVYRAPANAFVADFMGSNNLIIGRVGTAEDGFLPVESPLGAFRVKQNNPVAVNAEIGFVIGADRLDIAAADMMASAGSDSVVGTVLGMEFVGSTQTVFVDVSGREFKVQKQQRDIEMLELAPGRPVRLSWDPQHTWQLASIN